MIKRTPFYDIHKSLGARMVEFGGWEMPVQYSSILAEHHAVRTQVGLFDISHMGKILVSGTGAKDTVQRITCNDLNRLEPGHCQYNALLTPQGTFVDDIIVYPFSNEQIFICVNAINTEKDFEWIVSHVRNDVGILDVTTDWCQLALQGPLASSVLEKVVGNQMNVLKRFHYAFIDFLGHKFLLSRTGYTGEDGFEFYGPSLAGPRLWETLMESGQDFGLIPCGLGARDILRLEAGYPLYGHEIDDTINPFEAGLAWIVKLDTDDFIGKTALTEIKNQGVIKKLVGFKMDEPGIPRQGNVIYSENEAIGKVASGTFSPTLNVGIGTTYVPVPNFPIGHKIAVDIHRKKRKATITTLAFLKKNEVIYP